MALQADGSLSQRALVEVVGLSQNACWRRLRRLIDGFELSVVTSHFVMEEMIAGQPVSF